MVIPEKFKRYPQNAGIEIMDSVVDDFVKYTNKNIDWAVACYLSSIKSLNLTEEESNLWINKNYKATYHCGSQVLGVSIKGLVVITVERQSELSVEDGYLVFSPPIFKFLKLNSK